MGFLLDSFVWVCGWCLFCFCFNCFLFVRGLLGSVCILERKVFCVQICCASWFWRLSLLFKERVPVVSCRGVDRGCKSEGYDILG